MNIYEKKHIFCSEANVRMLQVLSNRSATPSDIQQQGTAHYLSHLKVLLFYPLSAWDGVNKSILDWDITFNIYWDDAINSR